MPTPILAFCADLQARESAYRSIKELTGDDLYALQQVVDYCSKHNVPLIMGGDQVDTPTISDEHTVALRKILLQIPPHNNWYIDGNHERGFKRLCLEGGPAAAATNMEGAIVRIGEYTATGYNWRTRRQWEAYMAENELQQTDVLVLHGFAEQVVPSLGLPAEEAPLCDLDLNWFDGKYKLVLMGDIHMEWDWRGPKGTRFLYSGSMWMHRLGEPEAKSFIVVNDDLSIERVPLRCRPFMRTELIDGNSIKRIQLWLDNTNTLPYVAEMQQFLGTVLPRLHLQIPTEMTAELSAALERFKQSAFVFEKVDLSHDRDLTEVKGSLSERVDLNSALVQLLDVKDLVDSEAIEFVKQAMELGFDKAVTNLKEKIGI
jgi:hypothetical protein